MASAKIVPMTMSSLMMLAEARVQEQGHRLTYLRRMPVPEALQSQIKELHAAKCQLCGAGVLILISVEGFASIMSETTQCLEEPEDQM